MNREIQFALTVFFVMGLMTYFRIMDNTIAGVFMIGIAVGLFAYKIINKPSKKQEGKNKY